MEKDFSQVVSDEGFIMASDRLGEMAERSKAADCKSADVCLRRFESFFPHGIIIGYYSIGPREAGGLQDGSQVN